jgi:hypothetical protein
MTCLDEDCPLAGLRHCHKPGEDKGLAVHFIPLDERAALVGAARVQRNRVPKPGPSLTFPGYKGEPSILPGMGKKAAK